ncbi:cytochrome P450 family protein [Streptomyces hygroscopicus]|uniref:cytochrome P450 family protein n=1 Tax=Streptomyces hygroscopicus TaxID=1912 RepID=UPI001FCC6239|nr:cytochrome P450 [Streptomyces hygroscopicus]BDH10509.1 cytochrome P450 hydroxylase [Streptomyces hygroscopicus]
MTMSEVFNDVLLADPHSGYAKMREAGRVHQATTPDGEPVWVVARYEDVRKALADNRLSLNKVNARTRGNYQSSMPPELDAHLLNMDAPDHTRLRRLVSKAFTPRRIEALRDRVHSLTKDLLDTVHGPQFDIMATLANPLPMNVICELLGIPSGSRGDFRDWTNLLISPTPGAVESSRSAMRSMHKFLVAVINDKRRCPTDDLLSAMIESRDEHEHLSESELVAMAFLILFAGYENSTHLIGNATVGLLLHPEHLAAVREGRTSVRAVVEETLRWNSPFPLGVRRFALEDLVIGGVEIPAGGRVWVSLISANHDERLFESPRDFDPSRTPAHLAFGRGIHYCLGAPLARLEAEVAITSLLDRWPHLQLSVSVEQLEWWQSFHKRGLLALPVTA